MKIEIFCLVLVCAECAAIRPHSLAKSLTLRGGSSMSLPVVPDENHLLTVLEQTTCKIESDKREVRDLHTLRSGAGHQDRTTSMNTMLSRNIPGKLDDQRAVVITEYSSKLDLSRSMKRINVFHAFNAILQSTRTDNLPHTCQNGNHPGRLHCTGQLLGDQRLSSQPRL